MIEKITKQIKISKTQSRVTSSTPAQLTNKTFLQFNNFGAILCSSVGI